MPIIEVAKAPLRTRPHRATGHRASAPQYGIAVVTASVSKAICAINITEPMLSARQGRANKPTVDGEAGN